MSTKAEKIEAQARAYFSHRHAVGPVEIRKLLDAHEILKELIPYAESMSKFCEDYGPGSNESEKFDNLIRRAKEVV